MVIGFGAPKIKDFTHCRRPPLLRETIGGVAWIIAIVDREIDEIDDGEMCLVLPPATGVRWRMNSRFLFGYEMP